MTMASRSVTRPNAVTAAAGQRALVYGFLAAALRAPLPAGSLAAIAVDPGAAGNPVGDAVQALRGNAAVGDWTAAAADLAQEHARLFLGLRQDLGPTPPYESLWREGQCLGDSNRRVAAAFAEAGFSAPGGGEVCDHLAIELTFMASLCQAEDAAAEAGDDEQVALRQGQQRAFLNRHLLRWVPDYCAAVAAQTPVRFYQALLGELAALLVREAALLDGADASPAFGYAKGKVVGPATSNEPLVPNPFNGSQALEVSV